MNPALVLRADALRLPLPDESVDLIMTSPPYFALRSYRDGDEHYTGQLGSEPTPQAFLEALWAVMHECWRVLKPSGSCFVNLGDKRSGSGGHNNGGIAKSNWHTLESQFGTERPSRVRRAAEQNSAPPATRRNAPDRYNQASFGRPKSKMLLPHRFAEGCMDGLASPCACPEIGGYRCPSGMHRASGTCVLHGRCRTAWVMRSDIVWQKLNGLPESVTDRVRDSHEYLFHFTKEGRYFAAVDEVREPYAEKTYTTLKSGWGNHNPNTEFAKAKQAQWNEAQGITRADAMNKLGTLPGSVWPLPSEPLIISPEVKAHYDLPDHFAAFPTELVRRVILGWSPSGVCVECGEGRRPVVDKRLRQTGTATGKVKVSDLGEYGNDRGWNGEGYKLGATEATITGYACRCGIPAPPTRPAVVLDVFGGTGTTAGVARILGRIGVSVDLSWDYSRLAKWRINQSDHFHKAAGFKKPPKVMPGSLPLF